MWGTCWPSGLLFCLRTSPSSLPFSSQMHTPNSTQKCWCGQEAGTPHLCAPGPFPDPSKQLNAKAPKAQEAHPTAPTGLHTPTLHPSLYDFILTLSVQWGTVGNGPGGGGRTGRICQGFGVGDS